ERLLRLAEEDVNLWCGGGLNNFSLERLTSGLRGHGRDEAAVRVVHGDAGRCGDEGCGQARDLRHAAAGQQRDDAAPAGEAERGACGLAIDDERDVVGQRMSDE